GPVPLNESPLKDHPLNPMHDSNLVRVLARQSRTRVGLVDLAEIARGPDAVRARLLALSQNGFGAVWPGRWSSWATSSRKRQMRLPTRQWAALRPVSPAVVRRPPCSRSKPP